MLKSLYGSVSARKPWDYEQSAWLEQQFGFECFQCDGNIYSLCEEKDFLMLLLNVVDDEFYFFI
jgi:hypothetical protein